jgi:hypothetical protein
MEWWQPLLGFDQTLVGGLLAGLLSKLPSAGKRQSGDHHAWQAAQPLGVQVQMLVFNRICSNDMGMPRLPISIECTTGGE